MMSADSRLAAISKLDEVRGEGSQNRLTIVRPRRVGSFLMSRSSTGQEASAVSRSSSTSSRERSSMLIRSRLGMVASPSAHEDDLVDAVAFLDPDR